MAPVPTRKAQRAREEYTIGWICALPLEMAVARAMLDEEHSAPPIPQRHENNYILGSIGLHDIGIVCLPAGVYGTTSAASVTTQMISTFPSIRFSLMVRIGGGVPNRDADIRLGDVVVSKPIARNPGVVQYDYGETVAQGQFEQTGALDKPPQALLTVVAMMQAQHLVHGNRMLDHLAEMVARHPRIEDLTSRGQGEDHLYKAEYDHPEEKCTDCNACDPSQRVRRPKRSDKTPVVHYEIIASGNQVMKHGKTRDRLAGELGILCFEMEAAGLMDNLPCLVIRGISDYAYSHKNKG